MVSFTKNLYGSLPCIVYAGMNIPYDPVVVVSAVAACAYCSCQIKCCIPKNNCHSSLRCIAKAACTCGLSGAEWSLSFLKDLVAAYYASAEAAIHALFRKPNVFPSMRQLD